MYGEVRYMDNKKHFDVIIKKYNAQGKDIHFLKAKIKASIRKVKESNEEFENSHEYKELVDELNFLKNNNEQEHKEIIKSEDEVEISIAEKKELMDIISEKLPSIVSKQIEEKINELSKKAIEDKDVLKESVEKFKSYTEEVRKGLKNKGKATKIISLILFAITFLWQLPGKWKENILAQEIISIDSNLFKITWTNALIICVLGLILYKIKESDYYKKVEKYANDIFQEEIFEKFREGHSNESFNKKDLVDYINFNLKVKRRKMLTEGTKTIFLKRYVIKNEITYYIRGRIDRIFYYKVDMNIIENLAEIIIDKALINGAISKKNCKAFLDRYEFGDYERKIDFTDMSKVRLYADIK